MVNWPERKRNDGSRVAVKLNSLSVQCRTAVTVSRLRFDISRSHIAHDLPSQAQTGLGWLAGGELLKERGMDDALFLDPPVLEDATIPGLPGHYRGKVRDNYDLPDGRRVLIA